MKNTVLILIPRHTDRTNEIKTSLEELDLKVHIHCNKNKINKKFDVYLIDTYGETQKFYSISKSVFLGKSIETHGGRSGQNPLEATREGCKIYHGPYVSNFQEIYSFLNKNQISKKIKTTDQLAKYLSFDLNSKQNNNKKIKNRLNKIGKIMLKNIYTEVRKFF
jgi:3-deoxy-D-manno-octulosonic-acid transferase